MLGVNRSKLPLLEDTPKILLVEPDDATAAQLSRLFSREGFKVVRVTCGETALAELGLSMPDLIVSDYRLPGMNGGQMVRRIRMNTAVRATPILMLTADAVPGQTGEGFESGADAYISRTAHPDLVLLRMRALLRDGSAYLPAETSDSFRRGRIVIVTRPVDEEEVEACSHARWSRNDEGVSLGQLLWQDGHTVTTVSGSSEMIQGGWFSGEEGPDCLVLDLTSPHTDLIAYCKSIDSRRQDSVAAGAPPFRMIGVVVADRFRKYSSVSLFDAGLDDLVSSDIAPEVFALRVKVMVQRKLAQDQLREEEIRRQVREVALQTAQNEARAIAAKAAMAEALAQANAELAEANAQLLETQSRLVQAAKMASLGELVAGIAHEINNPLAFTIAHEETVSRLLNALRDASRETDDAVREVLLEKSMSRVGAMRMGLQRIQNLVLSLRRFSRLDEGAFRQVDVFDEIDTSLALLNHKFGCDIVVERRLAAPRVIVCQPALINQAVMNIISNAADAIRERPPMPAGHACTPAARMVAPGVPLGRIVIETSLQQLENGSFYVISIADDGPGVPHGLIGRVFEPFFTTKSVGMGTGLGLSIAYGVIEAHGGTIDVSEAQLKDGRDKGARFTLTIPVRLTPTGPETVRGEG